MSGSGFHSLPELDLERASAARVYDFLLGGKTNYAVDREFVARAKRLCPLVEDLARVNREFLQRAVVYLAREGITQFLDLGSGIPTMGNVHEIADVHAPDTRVVYVDYEQVAVAHSRLLLEEKGDPGRHAVVLANMLDAHDVWYRAVDTGVLKPELPVAVLGCAAFHFNPGEDMYLAVDAYRDLLAPDSALVVSHVTDEEVPDDLVPQIRAFVSSYGDAQAQDRALIRTHKQIDRFFGDFRLEKPGAVWLPRWRVGPEYSHTSRKLVNTPERSCLRGGVARKRRASLG